jgi:CRISPR-associated endonuclease Csn1
LRAKAATGEISLEQFARVLLMINKKRGYKSSRKAKVTEEGTLIDGMEIAKHLYNEKLTPGQYCYQLLQKGKHNLPDFYRTDLLNEFEKVFEKQRTYYPEILTKELQEKLNGKKRDAVWAICAAAFKEKGIELVGVKRLGKQEDQKKENYFWRAKGLSEKLELEQLVIVLQQINSQLNSSSGYLGAISDRSKELFFNKQTVGQYQLSVLEKNPNASLRNMVFYRQDYLDEFNVIWEEQAKHHLILTEELKSEIRDVIIFYQRKLKSQKGL